jgi:hypothetical protein
MNAFLYGVFVSLHGGLGGPPSGGFLSYTCYYCSSMSLNM